jgi:4a-hydroxytetrahydrobiopterin dehydratase
MAEEAQRLTGAQVAEGLTDLPGWEGDAERIAATYAMATFPVAIELVGLVARTAEEANHHPDIDIRWRRVTFRLTTHDAGGVTGKDLALAERIQAHARALGWQPA